MNSNETLSRLAMLILGLGLGVFFGSVMVSLIKGGELALMVPQLLVPVLLVAVAFYLDGKSRERIRR